MSEKVTIKVERKELHLPTIALRGLVVFPNNLVHFEVGREKSIAAVEWAMANNSNVFLVAQKEMETSEPTQQDLYTYGVVAEVKQVLRVSDELVKVLVEGKYRAKLTELDTTGDFLLSAVRSAPVRAAKPEEAVETEALLRALKTGFDEYLGMNPRLAKDVVFTIVSSDDPMFLTEYMPANLLFRYEDKQAVMNENTLNGRLQRLVQVLRVSDELVKVLVEGKYRAKLTELDTTGDFLLSAVRSAPVRAAKPEEAVETEALLRALKTGFDEYLGMNPRLAKDVVFTIVSSDDPMFLTEYMPANLLFRYEDKQAVMNENTLNGRLQRLVEMLRRECQVMKIEKEIAEKVNESMDKNQRDYYLHEQLHIINDELGEGDDTHAEADDYRRKIRELHLAEDSEKKLLKEVDRLSRMQSSNQEATVIRTYLDTCLDLPWNTMTVDDLDIHRAQQILDRDHYGLKKVKDRILEMLAVRKLAPDVKAQIICLVGPPGVGKTSIARSIAESLGRKYVRISLGGVRDEAEIRGHRRTYIGAMPGKIISAMITAKSSNPLMLLDEIDKLAGDFRGDPAAALLEALDPEQNSTFNDHFIDIPFDLSHVLFITTANDLGSIPGPLRDRMDVIELPSYTRVEKYNIARKHLLPKQLKACGLTGKVTMNQSALYGIIDGYTREAGVRNLERTITSVLRKCARKIAAGEVESVAVTATMLEELLGPRIVKPDFLNRTNAVGIANGLAWTSVGGETLPIEVQVMDNGTGKITVTGSLGDVMKESAQLAVTWVRVHAEEYGIDPERLKKCDLHIHAPEGAVPKDGPSAGVTLTTALVSCLSDVPVRGDVAMTGEITLHGNVLPIGGLREKSMAAYREGMKTVLIPKDNEPDLYDVDEEVKKNLTFLPMQNLSQVLAAALLKPKAAKSTAGRPRTKKSKAGESRIPAAPEKNQPGAVC